MQTTEMLLELDHATGEAGQLPREVSEASYEVPVSQLMRGGVSETGGRLRTAIGGETASATEPPSGDHMQLLELSAPEVHRFVAQRIPNKADAEDVAQQALLQALAKLATFRGRNFRGWLFSISRNLIVDHFRAQKRVHFVDVAEATLREAEPSLRTRSDAVHVACDCRASLARWLECLKKELRLEQQLAVLLTDVHGYSDKASAAELNMSVPSFKLLLHGARSRLNAVAGGSCELLRKPDSCEQSTAPSGTLAGEAGTSPGCAMCDARLLKAHPRNAIASQQSDAVAPNGHNKAHCSCAKANMRIPSGASAVRVRCCLGVADCLSNKCCFGVSCRLGIKCCRLVPKLVALRARLLEALQFG
jgi:RNA polymerase sigma factor (sigma-70 family)